jgi:dTMP kinase
MRGHLIVFEGLDGTGKTTQIELLRKHLAQRGYPVVLTSWNSSRLISKAIKRAKKARLLTPYLYSALHAADFLYRMEHIILPALHEGFIVIADRYAYTALARDRARNIDRQWIEAVYAMAMKPDLGIYCTTSIEDSLERVMERNSGDLPSYYESGMDVLSGHDPRGAYREFQRTVASEYDRIRTEHGLVEVDTSRSIEDVHQTVANLVDERLKLWEEDPSEEMRTIYPAGTAGARTTFPTLSRHGLPGKLITVEGPDRALRARQATFLYHELTARGYDARLALLDQSWVGVEVARKAMRKTAISVPTRILLSVAELALAYEQVIVPALRAGSVVVTDGHLATLWARFGGEHSSGQWWSSVARAFPEAPDCTVYLDTPLHELLRQKPVRDDGSPGLFAHDETGDPALWSAFLDRYRSAVQAGEHLCVVLPTKGTDQELFRELLSRLDQAALFGTLERGSADPKLREVFALFSRYDTEFNHPRKVAELAVSLFDQTAALHGYGAEERRCLMAAAYLHDIGHKLSEKRHEEFTYEAIMREDLHALTNQDREIIANVACLHRQPYAKMKFDHLARLSGVNQIKTKRLASLLRIADALDESGRGAVQHVRCYEEHGVVYFDLHAVSKALPERAALLRKSDLFEHVFQKPVVVARNWIEKRARQAERLRQPEA